MISLKEPGLIAYAYANNVNKYPEIQRIVSRNPTYQVKPIHIGFLYPSLHAIGNLSSCTDRSGTQPSDGDVLTDSGLCPFSHFRCRLGPALNSRAIQKSESVYVKLKKAEA